MTPDTQPVVRDPRELEDPVFFCFCLILSFTSSYSRGCWSKIRREEGAQPINLGPGYWGHGEDLARKNIKDEILHALGFLHEMNRPDRDSHITFYKRS